MFVTYDRELDFVEVHLDTMGGFTLENASKILSEDMLSKALGDRKVNSVKALYYKIREAING